MNHSGQNKEYEIQVDPSTTVDVLKLKLSATHNLNYNLIQLSFKNTLLKNASTTMQSLGVTEGSLFTLQVNSPKLSKLLNIFSSTIMHH